MEENMKRHKTNAEMMGSLNDLYGSLGSEMKRPEARGETLQRL